MECIYNIYLTAAEKSPTIKSLILSLNGATVPSFPDITII